MPFTVKARTHATGRSALAAALLAGPILVSWAAEPPPSTGPASASDPEAETWVQEGLFPEESTDADGDGVPDIDDNCPDTTARPPLVAPAGTFPYTVDSCGCLQDPCAGDSDQDGSNDCQDLCPNTYAGHKVGADGCPLPLSQPVRVVVDVKFEFDKATIQPGFEEDLARLRETLLRYPDITLRFEGHTDWMGSDAYNQRLSERRAEACRDFVLRDGGIDPARVEAAGFGELQPIATNETEEGRAANRRTVVELKFEKTITPDNAAPPPTWGMAPELAEDDAPEAETPAEEPATESPAPPR